MPYTHLADAAGIAALTPNVSGLLKPSDHSMLKVSAWASALWSLNSLLIGAPMAAALSAPGVGRQAGAAALHERRGARRTLLFALLVAGALLIALLTWSSAHGLFAAGGSLLATSASSPRSMRSLKSERTPRVLSVDPSRSPSTCLFPWPRRCRPLTSIASRSSRCC